MGDLAPAIGSLIEVFGPALGAAVRALVRTALGMAVFCLCCGAISVLLAANGSLARGGIAAAGCLALGAVVTGMLAMKSAVLRGLLAAVEKASLGGRTVRLVFAQLGVADEPGAAQALAQRIPLGEAEARLKRVIAALLRARSQKTGVRAWLARATMAAVFERVERFTLARFRSEAGAHGGVDLRLVRDDLGSTIDGLLGRQVSAQALKLTVLVAGGYAVGAVAIGLLVARLNV